MVQQTYLYTIGLYLWEHLKVPHVLVAVAIALIVKVVLALPRNLPPGPWSLPIVGYLPFVGKFPPLQFGKMAAKYGSIFSLYLGSTLIVILNDYEAVKETLVKHSELFSGRRSVQSFEKMLKRKHTGLLAGDGPDLRENRRHFLSTFRDFGMGRNTMEPKILDEISYVKAWIFQTKSSPTDLALIFSQSVSNVISLLCFGKRLEFDDPISINFIKAMRTAFNNFSNTHISRFMLWLTNLPLMRTVFNTHDIKRSNAEIQSLARHEVEEHEKVHVDGDRSDYVHAYMNEIARNKNSSAFNVSYLTDNSRQLFLAGTDTTSATLLWSILYMIMYPEVQKKVQKEIDEEYGQQTPSYSNKVRTPYTEAVIMEVLRLASTVPLSVLRTNFEAVTIRGYNIPKRTITLTNVWNIHHNPEYFPEPSAFKPERFIGEDGQFRNIEQFLPFGIGKRSCVGEALARMELYLYFTSLLQSFTFEKEENAIVTTEPVYGITNTPQPFRVSAIPRNM